MFEARWDFLVFVARFYFGVRNFLHKKRWLLRGSQAIRGSLCWSFGHSQSVTINGASRIRHCRSMGVSYFQD